MEILVYDGYYMTLRNHYGILMCLVLRKGLNLLNHTGLKLTDSRDLSLQLCLSYVAQPGSKFLGLN